MKVKQPVRVKNNQNFKVKADFQYLNANNYKVVKEVGRGSYGVVYQAEDKKTGSFVAIKINFNILLREQLYIEMGLLKLMRKKTRLPFLHLIIEKKGTYSIIMDFHKSKPYITFFNKFSLLDVKHYLYQLLLGLKQLKQLGVYHRDIKPSNFLYDQSIKRGMIVDFGLAEIDSNFVQELRRKRDYQEELSQQYQQLQNQIQIYENIQKCLKAVGRNKTGTQIFSPPQSILRQQNQSYEADIWPVGVIFLQFCSKRFNLFTNLPNLEKFIDETKNTFYISYILQLGCLFGKENVIKMFHDCFSYELKFPDNLKQVSIRQTCKIQGFDDIAFDLLSKLLCINPKERISAQDALKHEFFNDIVNDHID